MEDVKELMKHATLEGAAEVVPHIRKSHSCGTCNHCDVHNALCLMHKITLHGAWVCDDWEMAPVDLTETEIDFMPYIAKPVVIKAVKIDFPFTVQTLEGTHLGDPGDFLIEGLLGERYPCKPAAFYGKYEPHIINKEEGIV